MPFPILAVVGLCKVCAVVGGAIFCTHQVAKAYNKHTKNKKEKIALKGKSLEEARKDNEKAREEEKKTREELEEQERKNKELEKELEQARNKVNDPTLSEEERAQWRRKIVVLEEQLDDGRNNSSNISGKLKQLIGRIKDNTKIISGVGLNTDEKHWIWDVLTLENILIAGGCYVVYKMLKDDN